MNYKDTTELLQEAADLKLRLLQLKQEELVEASKKLEETASKTEKTLSQIKTFLWLNSVVSVIALMFGLLGYVSQPKNITCYPQISTCELRR